MVSKYIKYFQTKYQNTYKLLEESYNRKLTDDVVVNLQKYIVDTITSYTFAEAIQYQNVSEDYLNNIKEYNENNFIKNIENELKNAYTKYKADGAIGIVMKVDTGEILAISSLPSFNPENYQQYD